MNANPNVFISIILSLSFMLTACGGGGGNTTSGGLTVDTQVPVISAMTAQAVSGNAVTLTAAATDDVGVTGYCFKTVNEAPLAVDACFQSSAQFSGAVLSSGVAYYVWAKDAAGSVSDAFKGPCSSAGYVLSAASGKNTVCMLTDKGELVLELEAALAPVTVANFLQYANDGFYNKTTFHRVIPGFMIQGGGYTYSGGYQSKTATYPPIALEKTSITTLSNVRGTIAMARTSVADSATSQFFINNVDNLFLDAAGQIDGNGYAVFGRVLSNMNVVDQIIGVSTTSGSAGTDQPVTPVFIQWAYQLK